MYFSASDLMLVIYFSFNVIYFKSMYYFNIYTHISQSNKKNNKNMANCVLNTFYFSITN